MSGFGSPVDSAGVLALDLITSPQNDNAVLHLNNQ